MEALSRALIQNDALTELAVRENQIGSVGLASFANALKVNEGLTGVFLGNNSIGGEGVSLLADALKCNTALHTLCLCGNMIGDEGAMSILNALKEFNTTVVDLHCGGDLSATIRDAIDETVNANAAGCSAPKQN
jgi:Ran GTPase-activating protein (RanGAP) involved in mRNA processing and transport